MMFLQKQRNPSQNSSGISGDPTQPEQSWEKENIAGGLTLPDFKSYGNQDSVVLAERQTHGPMEENREPRNKTLLMWWDPF